MKRFRLAGMPEKQSTKHVGTVRTILRKWDCESKYWRGMEIIVEVCNAKGIKCNPEAFLDTTVHKSKQLKSVAGHANARTDIITLHPGLFDMADHLWHDRFDTFFHELAHIIADNVLHEKKDHGDNWRFVFSCFGFIPKACFAEADLNYRGYKDREEKRFTDEIGDIFDGVF